VANELEVEGTRTDNNIDPDLHESLQEYRDKMEWPIENLADAIWGGKRPENGPLEDHEIVEFAARKINMLRKMLLACGVLTKMVDAVMED